MLGEQKYLQWNAAYRHHGHPIIRQLVSVLIVKVCIGVVGRGFVSVCGIEVAIVIIRVLIVVNGIDLENT